MLKEVWLLCLTSRAAVFPNLSVLGAFSSEEKAREVLSTVPRENGYILYRMPLDTFVGHFLKTGRLKDGMGQLYHEHYPPDVQEAP